MTGHSNKLFRAGDSKEAHPHVLVLVAWNRLILRPPFHLQIRNDVLASRRRCLIAPLLANFHDPGEVMPQFAVLHAVRRAKSKFIQPAVDLLEWLAKKLDRFFAVLFKGRHFRYTLVHHRPRSSDDPGPG